MTPAEQARAFTAMLFCGVCLGGIYDLLSPLRSVKGMCTMTDMLYGLPCAAGMILTALDLQADPFRLYAFGGTVCGIVLYGMTAGAGIRKIMAMMRRRFTVRKEKYKKRQGTAGI